MSDKIWIAWERQRRSVELAASLNCELFIIEYSGYLRYFKCIFKTFKIVYKIRPTILFVQNPSMVLACFSVLFIKYFFKIPVVVDRHTNFYLTRTCQLKLKELIFQFLSFVSVRLADLTIVTNSDLAHVVSVQGGKPFVLTDKIPYLSNNIILKQRDKKTRYSVLFITSFASDEPIEAAFEACKLLEKHEIDFYVSGNYSKLDFEVIQDAQRHVLFTGFLSENEYIEKLFSVDVVLVLTSIEYTLLCGCYEAVAAEKPLVTTNTKVLKELFDGALFVKNNANSIANGVSEVIQNIDLYSLKILTLKKKINADWNDAKIELDNIIAELEVS